MKAIAVFIWIFINLVFFGMIGYIYLLWTQYWHYVSRHNQESLILEKKLDNRPLVDYFQDPVPIALRINHFPPQDMGLNQNKSRTTIIKSNPRFRTIYEMDDPPSPPLPCGPMCYSSNKLVAFKNQLIVKLRRVLHEESNVFKNLLDNPYGVSHSIRRGVLSGGSKKLVCDLFRSLPKVHTISRQVKPFADTDLGKSVPLEPLFSDNDRYNNCAIVTNAASFIGSKLGPLIDSHDFVLRFNHAPTLGYEEDVGSKTSLRILNSQVMSKPQFQFLELDMYQGLRLLAWDPCNYNTTLEQWRQKPDFDVFTPYLQHRRKYPETPLHLVDPRDLWVLWDYLQSKTPELIRRNPPSSGFLGLALLLPQCAFVNMFEYVPSMRMSKRCHYFDDNKDPSCTFGVWHPLAAEKLLAMHLNTAPDITVFQYGYIKVPGFETAEC